MSSRCNACAQQTVGAIHKQLVADYVELGFFIQVHVAIRRYRRLCVASTQYLVGACLQQAIAIESLIVCSKQSLFVLALVLACNRYIKSLYQVGYCLYQAVGI